MPAELIPDATHWVVADAAGLLGYECARLADGRWAEVRRCPPAGGKATAWRRLVRPLTEDAGPAWEPYKADKGPQPPSKAHAIIAAVDAHEGRWGSGDWVDVTLEGPARLELDQLGPAQPQRPKAVDLSAQPLTERAVVAWAGAQDVRGAKLARSRDRSVVRYRAQIQGADYRRQIASYGSRWIEWILTAKGWQPWSEITRDDEGNLTRTELVVGLTADLLRATRPITTPISEERLRRLLRADSRRTTPRPQ